MEKQLCFIFILFLCVPRRIVSKVPMPIMKKYDGNKIVGGEDATIQQYPYQVYLLLEKPEGQFQCGGSLISSRYVLTAAHCLDGTDQVVARVGSTFSNKGGTRYFSSDFEMHPKYDPVTFDYDVGYVRFFGIKIDNRTSEIIRLAPSGSPVEAGTIFTVTGWGATSENGNVVQDLMVVDVPVISSEDCMESYDNITPRMVCAGLEEGGKDSCGGDSGGPAVTEDGIQRGIVSYGVGCAEPGFPGVYTNVSNVRDWIRRGTGV